jgi:SAM-dependent methyltransferase
MPASPSSAGLEFNGERFVPGAAVEIAYLHWQRYIFAASLARGKRVLDVACGEGYGSAALASVALLVDAFDASQEAIAHAQATYSGPANLSYNVAEARAYFEEAANSSKYDLVLVFEFIEHLPERDQLALLEGIKRVLAPDGLALISTPDKRLYTDARLGRNPYHVRELYRGEFETLLHQAFGTVRIFEQLACTGAALVERGATEVGLSEMLWTDLLHLKGRVESGLRAEGEYLVAVCGDEIPASFAVEGNVVIDPAKKLIGEELYAKHLQCESAKSEAAVAREESREARSEAAVAREESRGARAIVDQVNREAEALRRAAPSLEKIARAERMHGQTVERLIEAIARSGVQVAEGRLAQRERDLIRAELDRISHLLHMERSERAELEGMLSLRIIRFLKRYWDKAPRTKALAKTILSAFLR